MPTSSPTGFNIGAVARLTGIARERIRIWERRYAAVVPQRDAANNRLYSQEDIDRLVLIRRLVDAGHAIGQIARLTLAELEARQASSLPTTLAAVGPEQALIFGAEAESFAGQIGQWGVPAVATAADAADAMRWLAGAAAELIVASYPTLTGPDVAAILQLQRLAPRAAVIVVYRFAPHRLLDQLTRIGIRSAKAPLEIVDLSVATTTFTATRQAAAREHDYRRRQFGPDDLQRLAAQANRVACECPRHLADLVRDLQAFEDYTLACEATTPADAALHREVYDVIARARALVEDALGVIAAEERLTTRSS
jgi:DNA-binding transcriptional MerR regulator